MEALVYGALKESLSPRSESPDAKMVMLQTPLDKEDVSTLALEDDEWVSARHGIWTKETENLPLEQRESVWPMRFPSEEVRENKLNAIKRNKVSIFTREMECRVVAPENSAFLPQWIKFYDTLPEHLTRVMAIDPVPPPSEKEIAQGLRNKDFEAFTVWGKYKDAFYLLDMSVNRGHEPDWTINEFFRLGMKWRPRKVVIETLAYQKTLQWILVQAMKHQRQYYVIEEFRDKRKKFDRIVDALSPVGSSGNLYVRPEFSDFISQFNDYPSVSHDDILDSSAMAISSLNNQVFDNDDFSDIIEHEKVIPDLEYAGHCP